MIPNVFLLYLRDKVPHPTLQAVLSRSPCPDAIHDPFLVSLRPGLGVQGAAIATVTAEWTGALVFLFLLGRKDPTIRFGAL